MTDQPGLTHSLAYKEGMADALTRAAEELRQGYTCLSGDGGANCPHSDEFDCAAEVIEDLAARLLRPADLSAPARVLSSETHDTP